MELTEYLNFFGLKSEIYIDKLLTVAFLNLEGGNACVYDSFDRFNKETLLKRFGSFVPNLYRESEEDFLLNDDFKNHFDLSDRVINELSQLPFYEWYIILEGEENPKLNNIIGASKDYSKISQYISNFQTGDTYKIRDLINNVAVANDIDIKNERIPLDEFKQIFLFAKEYNFEFNKDTEHFIKHHLIDYAKKEIKNEMHSK